MFRLLSSRRRWVLGWLAAIVLCEFTPLDFWLQDFFYARDAHRWLVDGNEPLGRALFYNGPKVALVGVALALFGLLLGPVRWRSAAAARGWRTGRRGIAVALLAAIAVPVIVGLLKNVAGVYCPAELVRYGGTAAYVHPFAVELCGGGTSGGHCWPAGHASGGFALLALTLLAGNDRQRRTVTVVALVVGSTMGVYQMLKGAHFLSHTVTTLFIALAVTRCAAGAVRERVSGRLSGWEVGRGVSPSRRAATIAATAHRGRFALPDVLERRVRAIGRTMRNGLRASIVVGSRRDS